MKHSSVVQLGLHKSKAINSRSLHDIVPATNLVATCRDMSNAQYSREFSPGKTDQKIKCQLGHDFSPQLDGERRESHLDPQSHTAAQLSSRQFVFL